MTSKSWDDSDIGNISAGLDEELREIFADMEAVLGKPRNAAAPETPDPADDFDSPLPDDKADPWPRNAGRFPEDDGAFEPLDDPAGEADLPDEFALRPAAGRRPPLAPDFERSVAGISPAAHRADLDEEELFSPASRLAPADMTRFARPATPEEAGLPEAEILPDDADESPGFGYAATVAELSPEDLARLIERAVVRGFSLALKKKGR